MYNLHFHNTDNAPKHDKGHRMCRRLHFVLITYVQNELRNSLYTQEGGELFQHTTHSART